MQPAEAEEDEPAVPGKPAQKARGWGWGGVWGAKPFAWGGLIPKEDVRGGDGAGGGGGGGWRPGV